MPLLLRRLTGQATHGSRFGNERAPDHCGRGAVNSHLLKNSDCEVSEKFTLHPPPLKIVKNSRKCCWLLMSVNSHVSRYDIPAVRNGRQRRPLICLNLGGYNARRRGDTQFTNIGAFIPACMKPTFERALIFGCVFMHYIQTILPTR